MERMPPFAFSIAQFGLKLWQANIWTSPNEYGQLVGGAMEHTNFWSFPVNGALRSCFWELDDGNLVFCLSESTIAAGDMADGQILVQVWPKIPT
jgi:hypothetical protein